MLMILYLETASLSRCDALHPLETCSLTRDADSQNALKDLSVQLHLSGSSSLADRII